MHNSQGIICTLLITQAQPDQEHNLVAVRTRHYSLSPCQIRLHPGTCLLNGCQALLASKHNSLKTMLQNANVEYHLNECQHYKPKWSLLVPVQLQVKRLLMIRMIRIAFLLFFYVITTAFLYMHNVQYFAIDVALLKQYCFQKLCNEQCLLVKKKGKKYMGRFTNIYLIKFLCVRNYFHQVSHSFHKLIQSIFLSISE